MGNQNKKCTGCPAQQGEPCSKALDRIHSMQAEMHISKNGNLAIDSGCDWYINSAEYNYSFWNLAKDLHGSPVPDKEICQLLLITPAQLREIYSSAIKKLIELKDTPEMKEFAETIHELSGSNTDNTNYLPDSFRDKIAEGGLNENTEEVSEEDENSSPEKKKRKLKKGLGMPIHRSGNKVDIYGLSSKAGKYDKRKRDTK